MLQDALNGSGIVFKSCKLGKKCLLHYSDQKEIITCTPEEVSQHKPLENGYSVIYRLRGGIVSQDGHLLLSEGDYFAFARCMEKQFPDYIGSRLKSYLYSLWFLGHHPESWEERLLVKFLQTLRYDRAAALAAAGKMLSVYPRLLAGQQSESLQSSAGGVCPRLGKGGSMNQFQPYIGLRPFTENERDRFFGRSREISIKIRANRLTLLLAASGVGKSSLLQAGIMPALRADGSAELIYHRDWAASPQEFKRAVSAHYDAPDKDIPLQSLLRACTLFSSGQQIILLDQFEEFFNYQRFKTEFLPFVEELSAVILYRRLPASFVISMREDFALELNAFKPFLPGVFDNYFRLEKLTREQARQAIEEPLKPTGWRFEPEQDGKAGLLEQVLNDLPKREQERQFGVQELLALKELPLLVEPPHLQIVCQELWLHHRDEAAKQISRAAYDTAGGTKGILEDYFLRKIEREQRLASAAFDHLIGQRATKIAHPLDRLAELTGFQEPEPRTGCWPLALMMRFRPGWILRRNGASNLTREFDNHPK